MTIEITVKNVTHQTLKNKERNTFNYTFKTRKVGKDTRKKAHLKERKRKCNGTTHVT